MQSILAGCITPSIATALDELNSVFGAFFDPNRIQPRRPNCGPQSLLCIPEANQASK